MPTKKLHILKNLELSFRAKSRYAIAIGTFIRNSKPCSIHATSASRFVVATAQYFE